MALFILRDSPFGQVGAMLHMNFRKVHLFVRFVRFVLVFILKTRPFQFFLLLLHNARQTTKTENDKRANAEISDIAVVATVGSHRAGCFLAGRDECYLRGSKDPL